MLRSNLLGSRLALGFSATLHAALLFASTGSSATSRPVIAEPVSIDVWTAPAPPAEPADVEPAPMPPRVAGSPSAQAPHNTARSPLPGTPRDPVAASPRPGPPPAPIDRPASDAKSRASSDDLPRFRMAIGATSHGQPPVSPTSVAPTYDGGSPVPEQAVDGRARLVRGLAPAYPDSARADGVEGDVRLELVVDVSGAVESVRVVRGVGHGLDESALRVAREFRFAPATKGGHPVSVRMAWSVQFRLQ
jgi:protein TonB